MKIRAMKTFCKILGIACILSSIIYVVMAVIVCEDDYAQAAYFIGWAILLRILEDRANKYSHEK